MAGYVTERTLRLAILGLVSVAVISMGAASIDSTTTFGDSYGGESSASSPAINQSGTDGNGSGGDGILDGNRTQGGGLLVSTCVPFLTGLMGTGAYFGAFATVLYGIKRRYSFSAAMLSSYGLAPLVFLAYFVGTSNCASASGPGVGSGGDGGSGVPGSDSLITAPELSPFVLVGVLGLALVGMAAVLFRTSDDQVVTTEEEVQDTESEGDVEDFAAAAGKAAERLREGQADVDNEVYRAWYEMTNLLDVPDPDTSTPGDFVDAAVELGIDREDVTELTRLFEEVRYGHRSPDSREAFAIDVFRNIEAEYGRENSSVDFEMSTDDRPDTDGDSEDDNGY